MQIRLSITLTLLSCVLSVACQRERELSYYDLPNSLENRIVFLDLSRYSDASVSALKTATEVWDVMHVAATLQGIVNPFGLTKSVKGMAYCNVEYWLKNGRKFLKKPEHIEYVKPCNHRNSGWPNSTTGRDVNP